MQTPSDSGLSTPSVFGLPDFMLEGDYMGMQTPQIVGMKNPVTAFRENKQLKRHETPLTPGKLLKVFVCYRKFEL